jgi:hypothetical protein
MRTIYKYPLCIGMNVIDLPFGAIVRAVGQQAGTIMLWAEVHPENSPEKKCFYIYGTGHQIQAGLIYIGTAFCDPFVWHVYEQTAKPHPHREGE